MTNFSDLQAFCLYLVHKYGDPERLNEVQKAEEFRKMYGLRLPISTGDLVDVAACCDIEVNRLKNMPANVRGFHEEYGERRKIYYKQGDALSGIENTILHEIREMMEPHFAEVCPSYKSLDNDALHIAANRFASAVLLPQRSFTNNVYETGLDVFELAEYYAKSISQVLLRVGEVLNGKYFFYGAIYDRDRKQGGWSVSYCTLCPTLFPDPDVTELGAFFPTKGTAVTHGTVVDMAIKGGKAYLVRISTLLDALPQQKGTEIQGMIALARPLYVSDVISKVALMVVLGRDRNLLDSQINKIKPESVKGFHSNLH
jgi:hypothetical protein